MQAFCHRHWLRLYVNLTLVTVAGPQNADGRNFSCLYIGQAPGAEIKLLSTTCQRSAVGSCNLARWKLDEGFVAFRSCRSSSCLIVDRS